MTIGEKIHNRRIELGLTLEEVGNAVGVGKSTVRKWEQGFIANMRRDKISSLATILQMSPLEFVQFSEDDTTSLPDNILPLPKMRKIPLLGTIACGEPILAAENIEGEVDIPEHIRADFALRCKGDSMVNARIYDGDIVYIRQQPDIENGEIAAVLIGDEATLKRVYKSSGQITLMPENSAYPPMVYTGTQLAEVVIIGKAVGFTSTIK